MKYLIPILVLSACTFNPLPFKKVQDTSNPTKKDVDITKKDTLGISTDMSSDVFSKDMLTPDLNADTSKKKICM